LLNPPESPAASFDRTFSAFPITFFIDSKSLPAIGGLHWKWPYQLCFSE